MAEGNAERDELLKGELKAMTAEAFEQLTYELAHRKDPEVKRLTTPDGGADTIRPATENRQAIVWQAKHYPNQVNWGECEKSLSAAIKRWGPSDVIFVFPRDLSEQLENSYQSKLLGPAKEKGVQVKAWTQSDLVRLLNKHDDIRSRFFGATQDTRLDALNRAIQAGGRLEDSTDLAERANSIADFTEQADPNFTYQTTSGGAETPTPRWDDLPYMTMSVGDVRTRMHVAAWPREGATVEGPAFFFNGDAEGQQARRAAVLSLAEGKEAIVLEGAKLRFQAPKLFREGLEQKGPTEVRLSPGGAIPLVMDIHGPEGCVSLDVDLRPVPPPPGVAASFAGFDGRVLVEVNIELLERPKMRAGVNLTGIPSVSPAESAKGAALLLAFDAQTHVTLASKDLFPETGEISGVGGGGLSEKQHGLLSELKEFYDDLVLLEDHIGQSIEIPDEYFERDVAAAHAAAEIIREGGGMATVGRMEMEVTDPSEIPGLPDQLVSENAAVKKPLSTTIFGRELHLGFSETPVPRMKIVEIVPHGTNANAPARVGLDVEGDPQVRFRLVEE